MKTLQKYSEKSGRMKSHCVHEREKERRKKEEGKEVSIRQWGDTIDELREIEE